MYLLLSGEGPGDMGKCDSGTFCDQDAFVAGPMAWIVDQLVERFQGFDMSHLETGQVGFVSETYLAQNRLPAQKKSMALKGKKKPAETMFYYNNARALAAEAKAKANELGDKVVAVLFRDSDGTASAGRGDWQDKRNSMIAGFRAEKYELGVAMMPKPKSEAWLLCATKANAYQHCDALESESGNDNAPNSLKNQLSNALQGRSSTDDVNQRIKNRTIDVHQIDMPSFSAFKSDLNEAVKLAIKS